MAAASVTSNMNQNNSYHYVTSSQANPQQQLPTAAAGYANAAAVAAAAGTPQTIFYVSPNVSTFDILLLLLYSYIVWYIIVKRRTAEYVMSAGFSGHHVFTYYLDVSEDSNMIFTKVEILPTIFFIAFFF